MAVTATAGQRYQLLQKQSTLTFRAAQNTNELFPLPHTNTRLFDIEQQFSQKKVSFNARKSAREATNDRASGYELHANERTASLQRRDGARLDLSGE